jgi:hypothetical protein
MQSKIFTACDNANATWWQCAATHKLTQNKSGIRRAIDDILRLADVIEPLSPLDR